MIKILFEFIKINKVNQAFDVNYFFRVFDVIYDYKGYFIKLEKTQNIQDLKSNVFFNFILFEKEMRENKYKFLTFYSKDFDLFFINVENNNKEKIILLEFLNNKFIDIYNFKPFVPHRSHVWNFLKQVDIIELEIVVKNEIIDYSEIEDLSLLDKINKNIERYPIQTTHISFQIDHNTIALILYGNRFEIPDYFDINEFNLLINKLSPIFS